METKDSAQYSNPDNKPKGISAEPTNTGDEASDIRKGAKDESQLERLAPDSKDDQAPNEIGSPPAGHVEKGE